MILTVLAVLVAIPVAVLLIECLLSLLPARRWKIENPDAKPSYVVMMPAHNEAGIIGETLEKLMPQIEAPNRVLVIADNCTDETAEIARGYGAEVAERFHETDRGKGFAQTFGMEVLADDPPDVVIVIDADTAVVPGSLETLAINAHDGDVPVQALSLLDPPENPSARDMISALAFAVRNHASKAGLSRIGMPCLLTGSGMAMPYGAAQKISMASGNIVEDMQMGVDFAMLGKMPRLVLDAKVFGTLPGQDSAATSQRTRWEHGHLQTIFSQAPKMILSGLMKLKPSLFVLGIDLMVPPLSLLVMMLLAVTMVTGIGCLFDVGWVAIQICGYSLVAMGLSILIAWWVAARDMVPLKTLLSIPFYVLWKIPIYFGFLLKRQKGWVRTERDTVNEEGTLDGGTPKVEPSKH